MRVLEEKLTLDGTPIYARELADVRLAGRERESSFKIDWHLVALPVIQDQSIQDPLSIFKKWLARILILSPIPSLISGESQSETLEPSRDTSDLGAWFTGLLTEAPSAYSEIDEYLKQVMPDLNDIKNPIIGTNARSLIVQFEIWRYPKWDTL